MDEAGGSHLEALAQEPEPREVTLLTLVHGWPDDVRRWLDSIRAHALRRDFEVLLVDNSGDPEVRAHLQDLVGDGVRLHVIEPATGWAEAANQGLGQAAGKVVVLFDPGVEVTGGLDPLIEALDDPKVAVAGPFAVRAAHSLHHIEESSGPSVHAIEGYCFACRKADVLAVGGFDRKFRFYRIADFELSFRLRAQGGRRAEVVPVPVRKHAHRLWESTEEVERDRLSKKNFYRFLDLWREREDLIAE